MYTISANKKAYDVVKNIVFQGREYPNELERLEIASLLLEEYHYDYTFLMDDNNSLINAISKYLKFMHPNNGEDILTLIKDMAINYLYNDTNLLFINAQEEYSAHQEEICYSKNHPGKSHAEWEASVKR